MSRVLIQGEYRASDRTRCWRIVARLRGNNWAGEEYVVETESGRDAMGEIVWGKDSKFNTQCAHEPVILAELLKKAGLLETAPA